MPKIRVPPGARPGGTVEFSIAGEKVKVKIPQGAVPGTLIQVDLPSKSAGKSGKVRVVESITLFNSIHFSVRALISIERETEICFRKHGYLERCR